MAGTASYNGAMDGNGIDRSPRVPKDTPRRRIVVTGAGGFIGRQVVAALAAAGHAVLAVSRQADRWPAGVRRIATPDAPWRPEAAELWTELLTSARADALVHLAALAHVPVDTPDARQRLRLMNIGTTDRLATAALGAGLADLVFISSIKAVGQQSEPGQPFDDHTPSQGLDAYGLAKRLAERRLERHFRRAPDARAPRLTILRPPLVYGPGVGANMAALARLAARGWPLPLAGIDNRRSLLFVGNLADAIRTVLEQPAVAAGSYLLADGPAISTPALVRALAEAQQRPARLWSVPPRLLGRVAALLGRADAWARLGSSLEADDSRFRQHYGWRPPWSLADGLARQFQASRSTD